MTSRIDGLRLRREMGRKEWQAPLPFGPDGWRMTAVGGQASVIVTVAEWDDLTFAHASVTAPDGPPDYEVLTRLHRAVWGNTGYAYQQFVPTSSHVNIHPHALHLWGRLDGQPLMLDFGLILGSI